MSTSTAHTAARGGLVTLASQAIKMLLLLLNLVVLGRLLSPIDFGLVAMVTAVVGVAELVRDFGITTASIQAQSLTRMQQNNLFWTNTALGLILAVFTAALSSPIAQLYHDQRLENITVVVAGLFLINGIQAQYQVELTRRLRFKVLALTDLTANFIALAIAIVLAATGAGYWALVAMQLSSALILLASRVILSEWHPGLPSRNGTIKPFLRYGSNLGIAQFINYGSANAPSILIGITGGAHILGAYSRASQLASIPVNQVFGPLTNVALSTLVRVSDSVMFQRTVRVMQSLLGYSATAAFSIAIVFAHSIVQILLGNQWSAVAPLLQILSVGAIFQASTFVSYWVFLAKDQTGQLLKYNILTKGLVLILTFIGSAWSVYGMVSGYTLGLVLSWPISLIWMRRLNIQAEMLFAGGARFMLMGVCLVAGGLIAPALFASENATLISVAGSIVGLLASICLPKVREDIYEMRRAIRAIRNPDVKIGKN